MELLAAYTANAFGQTFLISKDSEWKEAFLSLTNDTAQDYAKNPEWDI